ncbi:MAG TPA: hypothetical protein VFJ52_05875, partial [Terriglobia bacterium]|nr:hypothetical protein [Terriglobia bacterium]
MILVAAGVLLLSVAWAGVGYCQQQPPQPPPTVRIDLQRAIQLALQHNHTLLSARTQVTQSRADEVTASLKPNPVFTW